MLTIRLLGGASFEREGEALTGPAAQRHRLALLALLAVAHPQGMARETLTGLLWPDRDAAHARNLLNQAVHSLRRLLGDAAIVSSGDDLRMVAGDFHCDVIAFEAALSSDPESAVALYAGPFLEGFFLPEATEFTQWSDGVRERLRRGYAGALETLAGRASARADRQAAVLWWRRLAAIEPYSARVTSGLMQALSEAGDRAAALKEARRHAVLLEQEFDAEPDPEVTALAERLRTAPEMPAMKEAPAEPVPPEGSGVATRAGGPAEFLGLESPAPPGPRRSRRRWLPWLVAGLSTILVVALWATRTPAPGIDPDRVVIAPLENRTGDATMEPVGEMAADLITQAVSNAGMVEVVPHPTAVARTGRVRAMLRETPRLDPLRTLAEETGAGVIVTGSYYRTADSLQFRIVIIDANEGNPLRSLGPFSAAVEDSRPAIDQLRQVVPAALAAVLDPAMSSVAAIANYPPTYQAWIEWDRGRDAFTANRFEEAALHFTRAAEMDSTYLLPRLETAIAYHNLRQFARADSISAVLMGLRTHLAPYERSLLDLNLTWRRPDPHAKYEAARMTAALAPNSLAHVQWGREAARAMNRPGEAIEILRGIDLSLLEVRGWFTYWLVLTEAHHALGDHRTELRVARAAQAVYGDRPSWLWLEAKAHAARGTMRDIDRIFTRRLALPDSDAPSPGMLMRTIGDELHAHGHDAQPVYEGAVQWFRGKAASMGGVEAFRWEYVLALGRAGRLADAQSRVRELAADFPANPAYKGMLGVLAARQGKTASADRWSVELAALDPPYEQQVPFFWRACIAAQLQRTGEAVELLGQSLARALDYFVPHAEPCFDPIRDDPRFQDLMRPRG